MGWGNCGTDSRGRKIGYLHRGKCDHKGCKERIDRGVAHACGGMHGTSEGGCEGYFCEKHLFTVEDPFGWVGRQEGFAVLCEACKHDHNERLIEDLIERVKEFEGAFGIEPSEHRQAVEQAYREGWCAGLRAAHGEQNPDVDWEVSKSIQALGRKKVG